MLRVVAECMLHACVCVSPTQPPVLVLQLPKYTLPWTKREEAAMDSVLGESGKKFLEVASKVGTRSIAECINRYYKIHMKDEFKPTWRKMARLKRAPDGRNKHLHDSKVFNSAVPPKVPRRSTYDSMPRHDSGPQNWRGNSAQPSTSHLPAASSTSHFVFPHLSEDRVKKLQGGDQPRDFDVHDPMLHARCSLNGPAAPPVDLNKGHMRQNGRRRSGPNGMLASTAHSLPLSTDMDAGFVAHAHDHLGEAAAPPILSFAGSVGLPAPLGLVGSASLPVGTRMPSAGPPQLPVAPALSPTLSPCRLCNPRNPSLLLQAWTPCQK